MKKLTGITFTSYVIITSAMTEGDINRTITLDTKNISKAETLDFQNLGHSRKHCRL